MALVSEPAMKLATVALVVLLLPGCGARASSTASAPGPSPQTGATRIGPAVVAQLTDQTLIYHCPECGMDYDGPGQCSMEHADLVPVRVDYVCPLDHQAVAHAGQCPRCAAPATI